MGEADEYVLDDTDRTLARALAADGRATLAQLASAAGLSVSAVQARVRRLESRGVVTGYAARAAAATMFVYLSIVSVELHDFWNKSGNSSGMYMTEFFKNMGIMGGLLLIAAYGPGDWALGGGSRRRLAGDRL